MLGLERADYLPTVEKILGEGLSEATLRSLKTEGIDQCLTFEAWTVSLKAIKKVETSDDRAAFRRRCHDNLALYLKMSVDKVKSRQESAKARRGEAAQAAVDAVNVADKARLEREHNLESAGVLKPRKGAAVEE